MKLIPLTQGKFAKVDDDDFEWLSKMKWRYVRKEQDSIDGYAASGGRRKENEPFVWMHRLIAKTPKGMLTDHKDGNGLNNQKENLRHATTSQNLANARKKNSTGYKGVTAPAGKSKNCPKNWRARVMNKGKVVFEKMYGTAEEAARAYDEAARETFGEFAKTNFPV